jgi:hypothetical protein
MRFILQDDVLDELPDDWDVKVANAVAYVDGKVLAARTKALADGKTGQELEDLCLKARHDAINRKASVRRMRPCAKPATTSVGIANRSKTDQTNPWTTSGRKTQSSRTPAIPVTIG